MCESRLVSVHRDVRSVLLTFFDHLFVPMSWPLRLMANYLARSSDLYCDPEGKSRRVLIGSVMALFVDHMSCQQFPMLLEHRVGLDITILSHLLLPLERHRKLLHDIEVYVKVRDQLAKYPSTVEPAVHSNSFSVRYHDASKEMMDVRQEILAQCQRNQQKKQQEVKEKLSKHEELLSLAEEKDRQANCMACEYRDSRLA